MKKLLDLSEVKDALEKGVMSPSEASGIMEREDNQTLIHSYLTRYDGGNAALDKIDLQIVVQLVSIAWYIYTFSDKNPGMTDTEYDKLCSMISDNGGDEYVTLPAALSEGEGQHHAYPVLRGTLSKIYYLKSPEEKEAKSRRSLDNWIESTEKLYLDKTGKKISLRDLDIYVFPKWDGVSVIFEFDGEGNLIRALTRGFTKRNTAKDISAHFKNLKRPNPYGKPYGLKTEVMVDEESLDTYNQTYEKEYKQSRAIASGIINSQEPDERDQYLTIVQLRYMTEDDTIEKLCPEVFQSPFIRCKLGDYDTIEEFAQHHRYTNGLRCDGAVIHIIDPEVQKVLGRVDDRNKFEVAYKFTEEYAYSRVKDIVFQAGLLGRITPVVKIDPIVLKGNTISSASLDNMDKLESMELAKGDMVKVLYDIIPYVTLDGKCEANRSGKKMIRPEKVCPECGELLFRKGAYLYCENPECNCRIKGRILNYLIKMRIQGMSYATIDTLYDEGILKSITDLYKLDKRKDEICALEGFGPSLVGSWLYQIDHNRRVSEKVLFGALGIRGAGEKTFGTIFAHMDYHDLLDIVEDGDYEELEKIKGIGEKLSVQIIAGIKEHKKELKFLENELVIYHEKPDEYAFSVCFTKVRDSELETYIISMGGQVVDNVSANTTYLVVPNLEAMSNKVKEALKRGVEIIPIEKLRPEIEKRFGNKKGD